MAGYYSPGQTTFW